MGKYQSLIACRLIGIDVGGTKVRAIGVDEAGTTVFEATEPTEPTVIAQILRIVTELDGGQLAGVGIGVPGAVHPSNGVISMATNVPGLEGVALGSLLQQRLGIPITVENDVITAAIVEKAADSSGSDPLAVMAAGTGIGLGLVYFGQVLRGANGAAGEIADLPLPNGGFLEDRISISGLLSTYRAAGGSAGHNPEDVFLEASLGSPAAHQAIEEYARWLAYGIHTVVATVDPGHIVLTGGLGSAPATLDAVRRHLDSRINAILTVSAYGGDAPAHGAVRLAQETLSRA